MAENKYLDSNGLLYFWQKIKNTFATKTALDDKVDKVSGKGLSANDFTTTLKNKLDGIASGAEVNVQSDWNQTTTTADDYIKNKPTIPSVDSSLSSTSANPVQNKVINTALGNKVDKVSGKGLSTNDYDATAKAKVDAIPSNPKYTDTTYSDFVGSTASAAGTHGLVPAPDTDNYNYPPMLLHASGWRRVSPVCEERGDHIEFGLSVAGDSGTSLAKYLTSIPAAKSTCAGLMTKDDKSKLDAFGAASTYALKSDITSMYKHKGSVANVDALPTTGNTAGDVYNVTSTGMNYVWTGSEWDALGEIFTINSITNSEIDTVVAS